MSKQRALALAAKHGLELDLTSLDNETVEICSPEGHCLPEGIHARVISYCGPGFRKDLWLDVIAEISSLASEGECPRCTPESCSGWDEELNHCEWWDG